MDHKSEAERTLKRLLPRLESAFATQIAADQLAWQNFIDRLQAHFPRLFNLYLKLYSQRYDLFFHLENLLHSLAQASFQRPVDLRELDQQREVQPDWFQSHQMLGGVCYVDLFAGDLAGIHTRIPYFKELGLTYLHLMPLYKMPATENDGGYAVSSFREVHPPLGSMTELAVLARELRANGISLVLDLVINHTSNEHDWAERARQGDPDYRELYGIFPDRVMPDAYEHTLREIFPDEHPGAFTWDDKLQAWVWTTFHAYQWDLMYANPATFNHMAEEMLFLANQGAEVFRMDAVAFVWKELGTSCENLPEAHLILQGFNALMRIVAPAVLLKSEAIVHPDDVVKYVSSEECQLSYNPLLMALLWNTLATRQVDLLSQALASRHQLAVGSAWVNYVRCHDDIGWTFADDDAIKLGIKGADHRQFLNEFYRGRFTGSFARGLPFQENPKTGDCRISGTCASLAGLEKALVDEGPEEVNLAIRRMALIHGVILTVGGIPLLYLGDEVGTLNDYGYLDDPAHQNDSRWVHRAKADPERYEQRKDPDSVPGRVYASLKVLIELRKTHPEFAGSALEVIDTLNEHVLGYTRQSEGGQRLLVFANFSERDQILLPVVPQQNNLTGKSLLIGQAELLPDGSLRLPPLDFAVFG
ncbi:MAG: alpha-amylase family protein [Anaerolineaceae bacterium]